MTDNPSLLKRFYKIIDSELARAQAGNDGVTDVSTVAQRVKQLCRPFFLDLLQLLGEISFNSIIGKRMKRKGFPFAFRKRKQHQAPSEPGPEQLAFEGMDEFRGYPAQLTYEDKPGHVIFVNSRKSRESDREKAEEYLMQLLEWDKQRINLLKNGNRFARQLVKAYGDLPLENLVDRWKRDNSQEAL